MAKQCSFGNLMTKVDDKIMEVWIRVFWHLEDFLTYNKLKGLKWKVMNLR